MRSLWSKSKYIEINVDSLKHLAGCFQARSKEEELKDSMLILELIEDTYSSAIWMASAAILLDDQ